MSELPEQPQSPSPSEVKRVLEAALLASQDAMSTGELRKLFEQELDHALIRRLLDELREDWAGRGIELVQVSSGWRFRTTADVQPYLDRLKNEKPAKYSRAVLETLAIIAYRQPVTRGDIEDIRGVAVSPGIIKALEGSRLDRQRGLPRSPRPAGAVCNDTTFSRRSGPAHAR